MFIQKFVIGQTDSYNAKSRFSKTNTVQYYNSTITYSVVTRVM